MSFNGILRSFAFHRPTGATVPTPRPILPPRPVRRGGGLLSRRFGSGFMRPGLAEDMSFEGLAEDGPGFWSNLGNVLGGAASKIINAKAEAEVIKAQAKAYTPEAIQAARQRAEYENAQRGGMSTGTMLAVGALGLGALWMMTRRK